MAAAEQRVDVFVSYSHADAAWLNRVQVHLKPLVRDEQIDLWDDSRIQAGARWREEIRAALARARVAVLLISADFFSSDFIATKELPPLLEAERKRGLVILGVHLSASRFDRDQVLSEYQTVNSPDRPIESLPKSDQEVVFDALARRIEELLASSGRAAPRDGLDVVALPARPARCIGRDKEVKTLVEALLAGEPTPVLGPAGIGKSTVCLEALHDKRIAGRFNGCRYFVRLDGAYTAKNMLAGVGAVLGMPADEVNIGKVLGHLAGQPSVLALDNLETPWEAETLETEALLAELGGVAGLSIAVTVRSKNRPVGPAWREAIAVEPLGREDAKRVFLAIAGNRHAADALLDQLLAALDGVPLAIELLAYAAEAEPDLAGIWQRWQTERTEMLRRGGSENRLLNLAASLELSINGPRMTDPARCLLVLLGVLPDGIWRTDLEVLLPGSGNAAAATLRQVALAFDEAGRLRTLAPVREYVAAHHAPAPEELARAIDHYSALARELGPKCGAEGGAEAVARLSAETANIEQMLLSGLKKPEPRSTVEAAIGFAGFQRFSGLGTAEPLNQAVQASKSIDDGLAAQASFWRGVLASDRSDHDGARERYEAALPLYKRVGNVLGEANCIARLGDIALARSDHDGARERYEAALLLYKRVGNVLGEANCIKSLGDIALARSDHDGARERYEAALPLYRRVGAVLGEANCIESLGDIALARSDHGGARKSYEAALPLYRRVGDVLGEANCILSLGDIAFARSDHDGARELFNEALGLYARIQEPYSIGHAHHALAGVARDEDERACHIAAAREAWRSIGREDLVQQWLDQSGVSAG
jgi:tetratricopeptide (TPR) repeat protein